MSFVGMQMGLFTLAAIAVGFLWVIKLEYYIGARAAKAVGALGIAVTLGSLFLPGFYASAMVGILGGTLFWGATELPDQDRRVAAGMFKKNPKKQTPQAKEAVK
jgi:hypothetical protein